MWTPSALNGTDTAQPSWTAPTALRNQKRDSSKSLDFPLEGLAGKLLLDVGCGMGRFAEIVLKYGGIVVGADLSYAVDA